MKNSSLLLTVVLLFLVGFSAQLLFAQEEAAGKKLFMDNKCNTCHSVDSQQIKKTMATSKAPDLSNVGSTRTEEWITKWLKKEEAIDGKKHPKTWTGKDEDLTTLVKWLGTLKKS